MKFQTGVAVVATGLLGFTAMTGFAQGGPGHPDQQDHQMERDRVYDRDHMQNRDRVDMQDRGRDRDQDRLHMPDFAPMRDRDIYGYELMSEEERFQYREQIRNAATAEEREQLRAQHQAEIRARAQARGVDLEPSSEGPIYGEALMTAEERNQFREQLRAAGSDEERAQLMANHREEMRQRAMERGVDPGNW